MSAELSKIQIIVEPQDMVVKGKHALRIRVKNDSDRALVFNGEMVRAVLAGSEISCMDIKDFDQLFSAPETFASNWSIGARATITDALTIGSWQTAADMLNSKKGMKRYGKDEERRQQDEQRFGQRVLWPGDTSSGVVFFPCQQSLSGAALVMPVTSFFNSKEKAEVRSNPPGSH